MGRFEQGASIPTALSSMMPWALVFAADMAAGLILEPKNLRRNEMVGNEVFFFEGLFAVVLDGRRGLRSLCILCMFDDS